MKNRRVGLLIGIGVAAAAYAAAGWTMVAPGEVVVIRRLGRVVDPPWGPGLHWRFPLGVDRLDRVRSDAVRQLTVGESGIPSADQEPFAGEVLTGDLNLLRIQATLQYRVAAPVDFVLRGEQVEPLLERAVEASLSRSLARRGVDAILRSDRGRIAEEVRDDLQADAERLRLGVIVLGVSVTDARPPVEVAADFAAAQSAESRREHRINEAETYRAVQVTTASARGESLRESARADASRELLGARAEAQRFLALVPEAQRSRELTFRRLYLESTQALLERVRRKLILPAGDALDLTVLGQRDGATPPAAPGAGDSAATGARDGQNGR